MAMQNTDFGDDRRKSKRLRVTFTLTYQVNQPLSLRMTIGWDIEVVALMLDLSEEGMAISTNYDIPISTAILIKFTLINLEAEGEERIKSMKIRGEIRSNILLDKNERRLGIYFTRIDENDKSAIANFVKTALIKNKEEIK
jgi:c-di-GMP-binding flagellar brake protein YcgR